mgnify:FL=1
MMTDNEVAALDSEVGTPKDAVVVKEWVDENTASLTREEQRLQAAFRMWKFIRDDNAMMQTVQALKRVRACLEYLRSIGG